jgi:hypothetical protein
MTKKLGSPKIEKDIRVYIDQRVQIRATFDHGICGECLVFHSRFKSFASWFEELYRGKFDKVHKSEQAVENGCVLT